jgi:hypothetical protein
MGAFVTTVYWKSETILRETFVAVGLIAYSRKALQLLPC